MLSSIWWLRIVKYRMIPKAGMFPSQDEPENTGVVHLNPERNGRSQAAREGEHAARKVTMMGADTLSMNDRFRRDIEPPPVALS